MSQQREYQRKGPMLRLGFQIMNKNPPSIPPEVREVKLLMVDNKRFILMMY
jgi:hypothetical protein